MSKTGRKATVEPEGGHGDKHKNTIEGVKFSQLVVKQPKGRVIFPGQAANNNGVVPDDVAVAEVKCSVCSG